MKKTFLLFLTLLLISGVNLYSQKCQWAERMSGIGDEVATSIAIGAGGNIYVAGNFSSPTLTLNNGITLTHQRDADAYIAKYNSNGLCQWAQSILGDDYDFASSIAVDSVGNVFVCGGFRSSELLFNNGIILKNISDCDGYVAKYNSSGNCEWAQLIAGQGYDYAQKLAVDLDGNIYVTGNFSSKTLNFNNGITLSNKFNLYIPDVFIAKYNSNGICQMALCIAGTQEDFVSCLTLDSEGNLYVAGYSSSPILYFSNRDSLINSGSTDGYLAKFNSAGVCQWAHNVSGTGDNRTDYISLDALGNVYIAGSFKSSILNFNNGVSLSNSTDTFFSDGYIAKYNSNGICQWAQGFSGSDNDNAKNIIVDAIGNVYVSGNYMSPKLYFNNGIKLNISTDLYASNGFIANFNSAGVCQWAQRIGGTFLDYNTSIVINKVGDLYISGYFSSPILNFNNGISLTDIDSSKATSDAFIAKYETISSSISINPEATANSLSIKPNPANNSIVISGAYPDAIANIYNDLGVLVMPVMLNSQTGESFEQSVDVSGLPCGTYRIVIESQGKTITGAFGVVR